MAVRMKYGNLSYVQQPDARGLDLTSFREIGNAIVATAANLQERAIRNENAYNEMTIKMSEYNSTPGIDEERLAEKIDETQRGIKEKVDEDGGWFFADTAVTEGAKRFLTDEDVKTIMNNRAGYEQLKQLNDASDAPEELKAANMAMILEKFNEAGGSLGLDGKGKNSILSFGNALEKKGHDRSIYNKEFLDMMQAWKADKKSIFNARYIQDVTELMNMPGTKAEVKETAAKIIAARGGELPAMLTQDTTIESITEDEIRGVFSAILSSRPEFRSAVNKEAEIYKWLNAKNGGNNGELVANTIDSYINNDPYVRHSFLIASDFGKLTKAQQEQALKDPAKIQQYIDQAVTNSFSNLSRGANESEEAYNDRLGAIYNDIYFKQSMSSILGLAKIGSYTAIETKSDLDVMDSLLLENIKQKGKKLEEFKAKQTEAIGFSRANLPANAMMQIVDDNINTARAIIKNAQSTINLYSGVDTDHARSMVAYAEGLKADAENTIRLNRQAVNSMFKSFDMNNPKHFKAIEDAKEDLLSQYIGVNKDIIEQQLKKDRSIDDIITTFMTYGQNGKFVNIRNLTHVTSPNHLHEYVDEVTQEGISKYFMAVANNVGIELQTTPISIFTPISDNKAAYTETLNAVERVFNDNMGVWNFAMLSMGDDPDKAKFIEDAIGVPVTANPEYAKLFGNKKSGQDDNKTWAPAVRNLSLATNNLGRIYLKITLPAQGEDQVQKEAILYTNDEGANKALRNALEVGAQCCYNQAISNPTDSFQKQVANELMAYAGLTEPLYPDLSVIKDPEQRSLSMYNIIDNTYVSNLGAALSLITSDKFASTQDKLFPITTRDYKLNITRTATGLYKVDILKYNSEAGTYLPFLYNKKPMREIFTDGQEIRSKLPALMYKLNNGNKLLDNFVPTKYIDPRLQHYYDANNYTNDNLMIN